MLTLTTMQIMVVLLVFFTSFTFNGLYLDHLINEDIVVGRLKTYGKLLRDVSLVVAMFCLCCFIAMCVLY